MPGINKKKITDILMQNENIRFAYIFGSQVKNQTRFGSDLDIAVYFEKEPGLDNIGTLALELEEAAGCKVDLISLKGLHKKNPKLAYAVVAEGILLYTTDKKLHTEFKKMVFLYYLDFKPVIDLFAAKLYQRINDGKFAVAEPLPAHPKSGENK